MINKRLIALIEESKKYIGLTVLYQWIALLANIVFMYSLARMIQALFMNYFVFEEHGVDQVIIRYLERNKKSASVARKCGFTEMGTITDFNKYTGKEEQFGISMLTKADWERVQK